MNATLAMQMAARRVAWENTQLRDLLARKGVSLEEVERSLHERESIALPFPSNQDSMEEVRRSIIAQMRKDIEQDNSEEYSSSGEVVDQIIAGNPSFELNEVVPRLEEVSQTSSAGMEQLKPIQDPNGPEPMLGYHPSGYADANEHNSILHTVSDCFCPSSPTSNSFTSDDTLLEMSCETAASIISGMRENGDLERARSQLGCEDSGHCNVKNLKVLQVMEMN